MVFKMEMPDTVRRFEMKNSSASWCFEGYVLLAFLFWILEVHFTQLLIDFFHFYQNNPLLESLSISDE